MREFKLLLGIVLALALGGNQAPVLAEEAKHIPGQVEAAFLVNLFKFVEWPAAKSLSTATICFLRTSVVQSRVQEGLAEKARWTQLEGRKLVVRILTAPDEIEGNHEDPDSQILYLDSRAANQFWPFKLPAEVLTVSNQHDFATHGGMIEFIWDSTDTYRIGYHTQNLLNSGLAISGRLATLMDRVDDARFAR
jgi:hypothetical protein